MRRRFVSEIISVSARATTNKVLPLEAESSSSIVPQSAIVLNFDKRRDISSCKTNAVAFCTSAGTTLGMCRMSIDEELRVGQINHLGNRIA